MRCKNESKTSRISFGLLFLGSVFAVSGILNASPDLSTNLSKNSSGRIFIGDDDELAHAATATITADQAKIIAENHLNGKALSVELGNEDGYLVYQVTVQNDQGLFDVKVDAGNGSILNFEPDDGIETGEAEDSIESGTEDTDNIENEFEGEYEG